MANTIFEDVKKACNTGYISPENTAFDDQILMHVNTVLSTVCQLGVGPQSGFQISDAKTETWEDFLGDDPRINFVKSYVGLKTRMLFDPPTSSALAEAINREIDELGWRINVEVDPYN